MVEPLSRRRVNQARTAEQRLFNADDTLRVATHGLELLEPEVFEIEGWGTLAAQGIFEGVPALLKQEVGQRQRMGLRIVAVFGAATTLAVQALSSSAPDRFDDWWAIRRASLKADSVSQRFAKMRVEFAHNGAAGRYKLRTDVDGSPDVGALAIGRITTEFSQDVDGRTDAYELASEYLETLGTIVSDAWSEFSPTTASLGIQPPVGEPVQILNLTEDGVAVSRFTED